MQQQQLLLILILIFLIYLGRVGLYVMAFPKIDYISVLFDLYLLTSRAKIDGSGHG